MLKLDKSSVVNDEHFSNIEVINVTFDVLKLDRSNEHKDSHL